jgi:hypothetical protein
MQAANNCPSHEGHWRWSPERSTGFEAARRVPQRHDGTQRPNFTRYTASLNRQIELPISEADGCCPVIGDTQSSV